MLSKDNDKMKISQQEMDHIFYLNRQLTKLKVAQNEGGRKQIFVSHSRKDQEGKDFINSLTGTGPGNVKAFYYSFEGETPPHSTRLKEEMVKSMSVFLLKSSIENSWTASWINYEVGLAHGIGKNIWVFENPRNNNASFPIPYVTAYIQRPERLERRDVFPYNKIIDVAGMSNPKDISENGQELTEFTCTNEECKAKYFIWLIDVNKKFRCPVCGKEMVLK